MIRYIPLESIMNFIPDALKEQQGNNTQFISWAMNALRTMNIVQKYETRVALIKVVNHKANLPAELMLINSAKYLCKEPSQAACEGLCGTYTTSPCTEEELGSNESPTSTEDICRLPVNVKLFQESQFATECLERMKYVGNYDILCKACKSNFCNDCVHTYSVNKNLVMTTSFLEGWVCLEYQAEIQDDNGRYLIPDDVDLQRALATYAIAMHWQERASRMEPNAFQMYQTYLQQAEILLTKAKGKSRLMAIDRDYIYSVNNSAHRLLRTNAVWSNYDHKWDKSW